ncbi:MAG: hypothetical protein KAS04_01945 [Candidatus Aenigmarchaeota archaeon]|nr:hypothetical protein [Candidatus Aenigmarchaeota archaeon]
MKKGQGAVFLTISLLVITITIILSLSFFWESSTDRKNELRLSEDLYVASNAIKLGKLYYDTSMDYSVFQAIYNVAKNGGWETQKNELNTDENSIMDAIKKKIVENFEKYAAKDYSFLGKSVRIPPLENAKLEINKIVDGVIKVKAEGNKNIYFEEKVSTPMERRNVVMGISSTIERAYESDILMLHYIAKNFMDEVNSKSIYCGSLSDSYDETEERTGFVGKKFEVRKKVEKFSKSDSYCQATLNITVSAKEPKLLPVFNGTEVSYEPVEFKFKIEVSS